MRPLCNCCYAEGDIKVEGMGITMTWSCTDEDVDLEGSAVKRDPSIQV